MTLEQILSAFNLNIKLVPEYQEPAFRIRRTDGQELDIYYVRGEVDISTMEEFVSDQSWAVIKQY